MTILLIGSVELASSIAYRKLFGQWSHNYYMNLNRFMFRSHPYLVGALIEGAEHERDGLLYSHNSLGCRGAKFGKKKTNGKIRVVAMGGSTTYGVGVNNEETWPFHLSEYLGAEYEVVNLGVPGYSSVENLIQTALHLSDLQPDIAIYYIGLNDLRNVNVKDLKADYSDFHAPSLYGALGLCPNENIPSLAMLKIALIMAQRIGILEGCPNQEIHTTGNEHNGIDQRALSLYERNLKNIASLCRTQGIKVIFVPHVLLEEVLQTGNYNWWIPYIPNSEMDDMMRAYNSKLGEVSAASEIIFADKVLQQEWMKDDFVDMSHFNDSSNQKLAEILSVYVKDMSEQEK
ncbi:MAG: SGNH/GDSL hydrolase family protein [Flavobacteriales bacterium]|nr:SGNH/GDSL hydrolase family protein [Flavobacteriales bacterium]